MTAQMRGEVSWTTELLQVRKWCANLGDLHPRSFKFRAPTIATTPPRSRERGKSAIDVDSNSTSAVLHLASYRDTEDSEVTCELTTRTCSRRESVPLSAVIPITSAKTRSDACSNQWADKIISQYPHEKISSPQLISCRYHFHSLYKVPVTRLIKLRSFPSVLDGRKLVSHTTPFTRSGDGRVFPCIPVAMTL